MNSIGSKFTLIFTALFSLAWSAQFHAIGLETQAAADILNLHFLTDPALVITADTWKNLSALAATPSETFWRQVLALGASRRHERALMILSLRSKSKRHTQSPEDIFEINFGAFWLGIQREVQANLDGRFLRTSAFPIELARVRLLVS